MATKTKVTGPCSICGADGELSFEHVPPKAAFNDRSLLLADLQHHLFEQGPERDALKMRKRTARKGMGRETLCHQCNNTTGGFYGTAYVDWAYQGMMFRNAGVKGSSLLLPFHIFPGRVAKQIMCMFASVCGPGLLRANPDLIRFVLNRDQRGIPPNFRLYCFLTSRESFTGRQAGITGMIDGIPGEEGATSHTFSEISFPPFGYILTFDSLPNDPGLMDITFFTQSGYQDWRTLHLDLPVRAVNSYLPGDFRTAEEWDEAVRRPRNPRSDL